MTSRSLLLRYRLLALAATAALLGACSKGAPGGKTDPGGKAGADKPAGVPVRVAKAEVENVPRSVEFSGSLLSPNDSTISAEVEGKLSRLRVDLGDRVRAGQVLATINPEEFRLRMAQAEALRVQTQANLRRVEQLAKRDMVAARDLDDAQSSAAQAAAAADLARKKYADTQVRAPFSGAVARRLVSEGEYVKVGQPLFQIVSTNELKLTGEISERYISLVKPNDPVAIIVDALSGRKFQGRIGRVAPSVNQQTRTFSVEARLPNPEGVLKPGLFAKANVEAGKAEELVVVPSGALSTFAGVTKVYVIDAAAQPPVARERTVETAQHLSEGRVALSGKSVKAGESVAVAGVGRLAENVPVTIVP